MQALAPSLPPALQTQVTAGPLDETGWTLLVRTSAAAAKLRQMQPDLQRSLEAAGMGSPPLRLKLLPAA